MTTPTQSQLDDFARRLRQLETELAEWRRAAAPAPAPSPSVMWARSEAPPVTWARSEPARAPVPPAPPRPRPTLPPRPPRAPRFRPPQVRIPDFDPADLLGARTLALAGGVVTLLGIVFFFVLAVNHGWIGPGGRVTLGAIASCLVFGAGLELHRRYGETYSSLAAVGAGIAGGYATLLAAGALYGMVPDVVGVAIAGAIATVGVVTSIVWRSQIVAGLGLIGAMLVPVAVAFQGGLSPLGTGFVAVVLAATAVVALRFDWRRLLVAGVLASAPQILSLVHEGAGAPWGNFLLAAIFAFLYAGAAVALQLRSGRPGIEPLTAALAGGGGALAVVSAHAVFETTEAQGVALLAVTGVLAAAAAALFVRAGDLSALLAAVAFVVGGVAVADLLTGDSLVYAWAAEAAALSWLARRARESRFQIWSGVYLLLAAGHVLLLEAPPPSLFVESPDPLAGAAAAAAVALAAGIVGWYCRPWTGRAERFGGILAPVDELVALWRREQDRLRAAAFWVAATLAALAASLASIALFSSFDWAFVAVTAVWSLAGLAVAVAGLRAASRSVCLGAAIWLSTVAAAVLVHAAGLPAGPCWWSLLVLAAALFAAGLACVLLAGGAQAMDAAAYASSAAVMIAATAVAGLLGGRALAWTWAAAAVALVWAARRLDAPHLVAVAALPLTMAVVHALTLDAPPDHLFVPTGDAVGGAITVLGIAAAAGAVAAALHGWVGKARTYRDLARPLAALATARHGVKSAALWLGGALATYAASLLILAPFADPDWGWVAVAALWCATGLGGLLAGLRLGSAQLRRGGLVWLTATTLTVAAEGEYVLAAAPRSVAYLVLAAAATAAGLAYALLFVGGRLEHVGACAAVVGLILAWDATATLLDGRAEGAALLGLAAAYGAIAAALLRRPACRDLATLHWGMGLLVGGVAAAALLPGTWLVLAWAAGGVVLAWLSVRVREERFLAGSLVYLAAALAHALALEAPPRRLFAAAAHPALGAPAVLIAAAALAAAAYIARRERRVAWWIAGVVAVYGLSLVVLQLAETVSSAGLDTEFQRGQTAVSAFWGLLGLALLYAGLTRRPSLRLAGFALFAVSLGKIFVYDLPSLSSIERAFSFLAVGAVLLLGGFFYQRLSAGEPNVKSSASEAGR